MDWDGLTYVPTRPKVLIGLFLKTQPCQDSTIFRTRQDLVIENHISDLSSSSLCLFKSTL